MRGDLLRPRRAGAISRFILLGVVLPNVVYLGHWGVESPSPAEPHAAAHAASAHGHDASGGVSEHELHCHAGPSKCGGPQALTGSLNVNEDAGLLTPAGSLISFTDSPDSFSPEPPAGRLLEPPRAVQAV
jgi:hypothetical protein